MRTFLLLMVSTITLLLTACGTQSAITLPDVPPEPVAPALPTVSAAERETLLGLVAAQDRIYRAAAPLLVNNAELCKKNARNLLGFTAKTKYSYTSDFAEAAQQVLGLNDRLQVMGVLAGSGAAKAGVRRGDLLISVEDKPLPQGEDAERQAAAILGPIVSGRTSVKLNVQRKGNNLTLNVPLTEACAFGIEPGNADHVNAYADGQRVLVTRGMLNFTKNDEELAYVLSKEMAHNILGHPQKLRMSGTISGIIDNLIRIKPDLSTMNGMSGVRSTPQEYDGAADTLALYMTARAGYNIDNAPAFWQRLAAQYPATILNGYTALHPSTAYRVAEMKKAIAEIHRKQASGAALLP